MSNAVTSVESWERYNVSPTNFRYQNLATGEDISRRDYDNRVAAGSIRKNENGSVDFSSKVKYFPFSETRHRLIRSTAAGLTSLRDMAVANKAPGALPAGSSVSIRVGGNMISNDGGGVLKQGIALQTRAWNSVDSAIQELLQMMEDFRSTITYGVNIDFEVEWGEVMFRELV